MSKDKAAETIERLRKAAGLGIKVSAIYGKAELSPFRIKSIIADASYKAGKSLTDEEADAINAVLDGIKADL
jgi:hypothetical protein